MASGAILGECCYCDELVWEDDWLLSDKKEFCHESCARKHEPLRFKSIQQLIDECFEAGVWRDNRGKKKM